MPHLPACHRVQSADPFLNLSFPFSEFCLGSSSLLGYVVQFWSCINLYIIFSSTSLFLPLNLGMGSAIPSLVVHLFSCNSLLLHKLLKFQVSPFAPSFTSTGTFPWQYVQLYKIHDTIPKSLKNCLQLNSRDLAWCICVIERQTDISPSMKRTFSSMAA